MKACTLGQLAELLDYLEDTFDWDWITNNTCIILDDVEEFCEWMIEWGVFVEVDSDIRDNGEWHLYLALDEDWESKGKDTLLEEWRQHRKDWKMYNANQQCIRFEERNYASGYE